MPGPLNGTLSSPSSQAVLPGRRSLSMWQIRPLGSNKAHWLSLHTHPAPHPPAPRASVLGDIWKPLRGSAVPEPGLHSQAASWGSQLTGIHSRVRAREAVPVAARGHLLCLGNCLGSLASHPPHLAPYPHVHLEAGTPSPASLEPCGVAASLRCTVTAAASRPPRPGPRRPHGGGASFHPPAAAVVQHAPLSSACSVPPPGLRTGFMLVFKGANELVGWLADVCRQLPALRRLPPGGFQLSVRPRSLWGDRSHLCPSSSGAGESLARCCEL